jgi:hypothetical protein
VPLGVVGMVYEGRPNVTVDAFGLTLKSGNAALLRGSSSAANSNTELVTVLRGALCGEGLPEDAVQLDIVGKHVYPGMIDPVTNLGIYEFGAVGQAADRTRHGSNSGRSGHRRPEDCRNGFVPPYGTG